MEKKDKIYVVNMSNGIAVVNLPDLRFKREWPVKGARIAIDRDILDEAMYDPGFSYMINTGILYIEDMDTKKELGIEPEDATEPVNVIILSDEKKDYYLRVCSYKDFVEMAEKLPKEQLLGLVEYAIEHECLEARRCEYLKKKTGRDILKTIVLKRESAEAEEE